MVMNIVDLPVEILDKICRYLIKGEALLPLECVCRTFFAIANRLKYHSVELNRCGLFIPGWGRFITNIGAVCQVIFEQQDNIRDVLISDVHYGGREWAMVLGLTLSAKNLEKVVIQVKGSQIQGHSEIDGRSQIDNLCWFLEDLLQDIVIPAPILIRPLVRLDDDENLEMLRSLVQNHPNIRLQITADQLDPFHLPSNVHHFQRYLTDVKLAFNTPETPISKVNETLSKLPYLQTVGLYNLFRLDNDVRLLVLPDSVTELEMQLSRFERVERPFGITGSNLCFVKCSGSRLENITIEKAISHLSLQYLDEAIDVEAISNYSSSFPIPTIEIELYSWWVLKGLRALTQLASDTLVLEVSSVHGGEETFYCNEISRALPRTSDIRTLKISLPEPMEMDLRKYLVSIASRFSRLTHLELIEFPWEVVDRKLFKSVDDDFCVVDLDALKIKKNTRS